MGDGGSCERCKRARRVDPRRVTASFIDSRPHMQTHILMNDAFLWLPAADTTQRAFNGTLPGKPRHINAYAIPLYTYRPGRHPCAPAPRALSFRWARIPSNCGACPSAPRVARPHASTPAHARKRFCPRFWMWRIISSDGLASCLANHR